MREAKFEMVVALHDEANPADVPGILEDVVFDMPSRDAERWSECLPDAMRISKVVPVGAPGKWAVALVWTEMSGDPIPTVFLTDAEDAEEAFTKAVQHFEPRADWDEWRVERHLVDAWQEADNIFWCRGPAVLGTVSKV